MRIIGRVRGILGKHFIETDELHISCVKGYVYIVGTMRRLPQLEDRFPITVKFVHDLKGEIKRLSDVRRVKIADRDEVES